MVRCMLFEAIDPSSSLPLPNFFFSLFKCHIASERHLFSIKMKEIIKKLKIKVSGRAKGRCRKGFIVPIR